LACDKNLKQPRPLLACLPGVTGVLVGPGRRMANGSIILCGIRFANEGNLTI
jgi:hypothetical protein